jgi:lipid II:glycine glycyltransferase (peptidoglycan interpeptide bridge formation enzyme)
MTTTTTWQTGVPPESWDQQQADLAAHFLQSRAWAAFQLALGKQTFYACGTGWSWTAVLEVNRFGSYLYTPYGPTARSPQSQQKAIESLTACAAQNNVDFVRIEPQSPKAKKTLRDLRAKHAHRDIQPKNTLVKDLDRPFDELYAEMASTNRRLYRQSEKNGFTFESSYDPADLRYFLEMIHEVAKRTGMQPHTDEYFRTMVQALMPLKAARFFIARNNGKPVSVCIVFEDSTTRYYAHAANAESARKLQPSVPLMGHLIFSAQDEGKKYFDYYGVAPPNATNGHKWEGFSRFKRSFGGREVEYSGTWEIPVKLAKYQAYRILSRVRDAGSKSRKFVRKSLKR